MTRKPDTSVIQLLRSQFFYLEMLMHQIFTVSKYNELVRPVDQENGLTNILTELKLLQIDLVNDFFVVICK